MGLKPLKCLGQPAPCAVHAEDGVGGDHGGHAVPGEGCEETPAVSGAAS